MHASIDELGRVILPKSVTESLDLKPGGVLEVEEVAGEIRMRPAARVGSNLIEEQGLLVHDGQIIGNIDVVEFIRTHRDECLARAQTTDRK